jgi:PhzF family phenazine biosynthesis protein
VTSVRIFQIDAFTDRLFHGNPAAVCLLDKWPSDDVLQSVAMENNLAETAFFVPGGDVMPLKWFTPEIEMDLCGHATLAAAWVVFNELEPGRDTVTFETRSGRLHVRRGGDGLMTMEFPRRAPVPCEAPAALVAGLRLPPVRVLRSRDYLAVYESEDDVRRLDPDMGLLRKVETLGIIATARGSSVDFVSRFFAPGAGIAEDPVTGSAHSTLIPYWAGVLGRSKLHAHQISARGGELFGEDRPDSVLMSGRAVKYLEGTIAIPLRLTP